MWKRVMFIQFAFSSVYLLYFKQVHSPLAWHLPKRSPIIYYDDYLGNQLRWIGEPPR